MAHRLPISGSDNNTWGDILNDFLEVEHDAAGAQRTLDAAKFIAGSDNQVIATSGGVSGWANQSAPVINDVMGRAGGVIAQAGDYTADLIGAAQDLTPVGVVSADTSVAAGAFVPVSLAGGPVALTLPSAPADKTAIGVKVVGLAGSNTLTINAGGSNVFNKTGGSAALTLSVLNQSVLLQYQSSGGIWLVMADNLPLSQTDARYALMSSVGAASGVAGLDGSARVSSSQLPNSLNNHPYNYSNIRNTVLLGAVNTSVPGVLSDFTTFNSAIAPRSLDALLFMQDLDTTPVFFSGYPNWAAGLGAFMVCTLSLSTRKLSDYAAGTYDTTGLYNNAGLAGLAASVKSYGKPLVIRLAHEFNGNWNNYGNTKETAAQFVAGWKHIVDVFRAAGATNILWSWNPNVWGTVGEGGNNSVDPTVADNSGVNWYPGDDYVDIVALDGYMTINESQVETPENLFLAPYISLTALAPSKPFAIGEFGAAEDARLSSIGGKAGWYNLFFKMIRQKMPKCILVTQWERADSNDYTISSSGTDSAAAAAFVTGVKNTPFVASPTTSPGYTANTWVGRQTLAGGLKLPGGSAGYVPISDSSGNITLAANPAAGLGTGVNSLMPGFMPAGAIAENFPRFLCQTGDPPLPASGTPYIFAGPYLNSGQTITHINFYQSGTAPSGQTHAWIALINTSGQVLAVTADAGATPWNAGTFVTISVALNYTPAANVQTMVAFCVVASVLPQIRGYSNGSGTWAVWAPRQGASTSTGQTAPPTIGATLGMPSTGLANTPYVFVS